MRKYVNDTTARHKPDDMEIERQHVLQAHTEVDRNMQHLLARGIGRSARPHQQDRQYRKTLCPPLTIVDLALQKKTEPAIVKMNEECHPLLTALVAASDEYFTLTYQRSALILQAADAQYILNRNIRIGASLLSIALAILAGWLISRHLLAAQAARRCPRWSPASPASATSSRKSR